MTRSEICDRLLMNQIKPLNSFYREVLPIAKMGARISYDILSAMHIQIEFAAHALVNAAQIEQIDMWGNVSKFPLLERTMFLQNAILTYNSLIDYVRQIIYFYYFCDEDELLLCSDFSDIEKKAESLRGNKILEIDTQLSGKNSKLYKALKDYKSAKAHNKHLAEIIKHRAYFWVEGINMPTYGTATKNINGVDVDITKIVTPPLINIDEEVENLIDLHNKSVYLEKQIYTELNFSKISKEWLESIGLNKR